MPKRQDLIGRTFGNLTVVAPGESRRLPSGGLGTIWICRCACGKIIECWTKNIRKTESCGCKTRPRRTTTAYIGDVFGDITIIAEQERRPRLKSKSMKTYRHVLVRCMCGVVKSIPVIDLTRQERPIRSCGCKSKYKYFYRGESALQKIWNQYKSNARIRKHSFDLTREQFKSLIQDECCYCGAPPEQVMTSGDDVFKYNGIDRAVSSLGYHISNCVSCCQICNKAKMTMSAAEFISWAKRVATRYLVCPPEDFHPANDRFLTLAVKEMV